MGMPSISISFTETGSTAISRGERGIIAMILKDAIPAKNPVVCKTESDVPVSLSEASKEQIALAFKGYEYSPLLVMIYVIAADAKDYSAALNYFKTVKFDYLVAPSAETDVLNINSSTYDLVWAKRKFYINNTTPNRVITFEPCYYRAFAAGSSYKLANGTCIPLRIYGIKG